MDNMKIILKKTNTINVENKTADKKNKLRKQTQ